MIPQLKLNSALGELAEQAAELAWAVYTLVVLVALRGYTLNLLWGWFITPAFALAAPSLSLCMGLMLMVRWITQPTATGQREYVHPARSDTVILVQKRTGASLVLGAGYTVLVILVAWIVKAFV